MYELDERPTPRLTTRERHALALARIGWSAEETATLLEIDPPAASRAVDTAIAKLGAATLADAIEVARQDGILR